MEHIKVELLDKNAQVQYGLNWGQRENRDKNQSYLQLLPKVYNSDYFPTAGKYFIVKTDDKKLLIFTRAQKGKGTALQTPESNALIGLYLRQRIGLESGAEINRKDILKFGKLDIDFYKTEEDLTYIMAFNKDWKSRDLLYLYRQYLLINEKFDTWNEIDTEIETLNKNIRFVFNFGNKENEVYVLSSMDDYLKLLQTNDVLFNQLINDQSINEALSNFLYFFKSDFFNKHYGNDQTINKMGINTINSSNSLQQIYYGAPGTGKSNTIKRDVEEAGKRHHRITFHPDSDYSTFVGAYKPTKVNNRIQRRMNLSMEDLAKELGKHYNIDEQGKVAGIQKFCFKYHPYINGEYMSVNVDKLVELAGISSNYVSEINKYIKFLNLLPEQNSNVITYEFVPQTFTKAYVDAWTTEEDVYLIIEEINRGNCAQIFGDLFQLLDRKNGISEYPIDADSDLENYLKEKLKDSPRTDFPAGVREGKKLVLPSNFYIWATMNTSDQSLFPIDSAFKRRWEWKYIPIKNHPEEDYKIEIGESKYDWWDFLSKINQVINTTTSSEDKKLGYFFAKAENKEIKDEQFVGKVLFYLWNDVFKNYGFDNAIFDKVDKDKFAFSDFFNADGSPNHQSVKLFLKNLGLEAKEEVANEGKSSIAVIYNGERIQMSSGRETFIEIIKKAINDKGVQLVAEAIGGDLTQNKQGDTRRYIDIAPGWFLATNIGIDKIKTNLNKLKEGLDLNIEVEDIPIETTA